jgi:hypothetical protein
MSQEERLSKKIHDVLEMIGTSQEILNNAASQARQQEERTAAGGGMAMFFSNRESDDPASEFIDDLRKVAEFVRNPPTGTDPIPLEEWRSELHELLSDATISLDEVTEGHISRAMRETEFVASQNLKNRYGEDLAAIGASILQNERVFEIDGYYQLCTLLSVNYRSLHVQKRNELGWRLLRSLFLEPDNQSEESDSPAVKQSTLAKSFKINQATVSRAMSAASPIFEQSLMSRALSRQVSESYIVDFSSDPKYPHLLVGDDFAVKCEVNLVNTRGRSLNENLRKTRNDLIKRDHSARNRLLEILRVRMTKELRNQVAHPTFHKGRGEVSDLEVMVKSQINKMSGDTEFDALAIHGFLVPQEFGAKILFLDPSVEIASEETPALTKYSRDRGSARRADRYDLLRWLIENTLEDLDRVRDVFVEMLIADLMRLGIPR